MGRTVTSLSPRWLRNTFIQIYFHCVFLTIPKTSYFGLQLSPGLTYCFFVCSRSSATANAASGEFFKHLCFVLVSVSSELEFAQWQSQGFWYIILLMASLWFLRLYLHYLSQWFFLQAISTPVTKWVLPRKSKACIFVLRGQWEYKTPLSPTYLKTYNAGISWKDKNVFKSRNVYYS